MVSKASDCMKLMVGVSCAALVLAGSPVAAQDGVAFDSIKSRPRPEYATSPITIGPFEVSPRVDAEVEYIDNVFVSETVEVNDTVFAIRPSVSIADRRPDREIRLNLSTGYETYLDNTAADRVQAQAAGRARFGLGTLTRPFFGVNLRLNDTRNMSLSETGGIAQPLKLFSVGGNAGVESDLGPITTTIEGRYSDTSYSGDFLIGGVTLDGGFRDYTQYGLRVRTAYSVNPAQRFYIEGQYGRFDYQDTDGIGAIPVPLLRDRSADAIALRAGYERSLTELIRLDVSVGYARQDYDDPAQARIDALSFLARAIYSPTELTRFRLQAQRTIDDSVNPLFSSFLRTEFALEAEHELRRNIVLSMEGRYATFDAGDSASVGDEYQFSAGARYFVSPRWSLKAKAEYFERTGLFPGDQARFLVGVGYNF